MMAAFGRCLVAALLLVVLVPAPHAVAFLPGEALADPVLEGRARELSRQLRCVVCQNQSIDDSNADIARDFRLLVRERLVVGDSDQEVLDFFVARYGDYVLLKPRFRLATTPLWLGPPAVLVLALLGVFVWYRSAQFRMTTEVAPLSAAERSRLDALVEELVAVDEDPDRPPPPPSADGKA